MTIVKTLGMNERDKQIRCNGACDESEAQTTMIFDDAEPESCQDFADAVIISTGIKIYFCEKCMNTHMNILGEKYTVLNNKGHRYNNITGALRDEE